jgi:ribonuclease J
MKTEHNPLIVVISSLIIYIGVDYIIPDMQFLQEKKQNLGIIITHAHEDHIGGLPHLFDVLNNVPFYATR